MCSIEIETKRFLRTFRLTSNLASFLNSRELLPNEFYIVADAYSIQQNYNKTIKIPPKVDVA